MERLRAGRREGFGGAPSLVSLWRVGGEEVEPKGFVRGRGAQRPHCLESLWRAEGYEGGRRSGRDGRWGDEVSLVTGVRAG